MLKSRPPSATHFTMVPPKQQHKQEHGNNEHGHIQAGELCSLLSTSSTTSHPPSIPPPLTSDHINKGITSTEEVVAVNELHWVANHMPAHTTTADMNKSKLMLPPSSRPPVRAVGVSGNSKVPNTANAVATHSLHPGKSG